MVQYYEMYRMVVLLNPSTTVGTYGMDGNLWSRPMDPCPFDICCIRYCNSLQIFYRSIKY